MLSALAADTLKPVVIGVHVAALAPGLACAIAADGLALSTVLRPLGPKGVRILYLLHRAIFGALMLLWLSGLTLVALKLLPGAGGCRPKWWPRSGWWRC